MRVLLVEDSKVVRLRLRRLLSAPDLEVRVEGDGVSGVEAAIAWRPDVTLMDLRLPRMDGLTAIAAIMAQRPHPIVVLSGAVDAEVRFEALRCGAVEALNKSAVLDPDGSQLELLRLVRLYAKARVVRGSPSRSPRATLTEGLAIDSFTPTPRPSTRPRVIAIGASTGGPPVIYELLEGLPPTCGVPVLVAQHIEPGFAEAMCRWLARTGWHVQLARPQVVPKAGEVWVAPGRWDVALEPTGALALRASSPDPRVASPSVDHLFRSVARVHGPAGVGVLLTGMGDDGARGLQAIRGAGGGALAQDEATCAVYGMPQAAARLGAAHRHLPPSGLVAELRRRTGAG